MVFMVARQARRWQAPVGFSPAAPLEPAAVTANETKRGDRRPAAHLARRAPVMLETEGWSDYALIDSGDGAKLERYGRYRIVRPEAQALWSPRRPAAEWDSADARFVGIGDDDVDGRWRYKAPIGETWPITYDGISFLGRFTNFRHVGVFPEQVTHWEWMKGLIEGAGRPL